MYLLQFRGGAMEARNVNARAHSRKCCYGNIFLKRLLQMEAESGSLELVSTIGFEGRPFRVFVQLACKRAALQWHYLGS